jgi:hypothetical protein
VFLQLWDKTQPVILNPDEVAAYRWVSFDIFTHRFQQFFRPKTSQISNSGNHPALSIRLAALLLPLQPANNPSVQAGEQPDLSSEFILWGITYRVPFTQRIRALIQLLPAEFKTNQDADWVFYRVPFPFCLFGVLFGWVDRTYGPDDIDLKAYQRGAMTAFVLGSGLASAVGLRWLGYL